jgi:hypothetical protein
MFNDAQKEELRRIVDKFVEQGRCARPVHPDQVLQEVKRFKLVEESEEETASTELLPRFQLVEGFLTSFRPSPKPRR